MRAPTVAKRLSTLSLVFYVITAMALPVLAYIPMTLPDSAPSAGTVQRWNLASLPNGAGPYLVNPTQPPGASGIDPLGTTATQIVDVVRAAFQTWEDVAASSIQFRFAGTTTATNALDLQNVVTFSPQGRRFPLQFAGQSFSIVFQA